MSNPSIVIDPLESRKFDISIDLQKIYYHPSGYQRTSKKLYEVAHNAGFDFTLAEVQEWLERQLLHLIHKSRPCFIQYASFNGIQNLNEMHQSDLTPMPHDKIGNRIFKHRGVIKDIATRFHKSCALTNKSSASLAKMFKAIYDDPNNHLTWPKVLIVDKGTEYLGECRDLLLSHGVKIIQAKSKRSTSIAERDHQEFEKHAYIRQDAVDFILPLTERCRAWVKGLRLNDDIYNDTPTRLIHMSPNEAVKRALKGEKIIADPSVKHRRPIGFNEPRLTYKDSVLYLLEPGELEFGKSRITDMNWSPKIYRIKELLIQKNQPVLYWLIDKNGDGPERSFVREQLMKVRNVEYPPKWVLKQY
ncbi:10086_t:CDS:1 [Acaulospora colombiana]|uniref:10086_t:CDS:1 n=1 Tax=Acaulospora colombiana TaxID=27376 RepID=A0ACA9M6B3_9GLOM|nr:10086_t:CDS:1 [Acaulospora colombiana]